MEGIGKTELYRQIVENGSDAIIFSDREGVIRLWTAGAERMLGFSAQEAVGQSLDLFIPEAQRNRHWEGYFRVMETGTSRYQKDLLAAPALCKDGTRISTEFSITIVWEADGTVAGTAAVMRDVTAKWEKEKALRLRLAELEKAQK